jgi:hypothetical protein
MMAAERTEVYLNIEHQDALKEIAELKNLNDLTDSKKIRYTILNYYKLITQGADPNLKINQMLKQITAIENLLYIQIASVPGLDNIRNFIRSDQTNLKYVVDKHVEDVINGVYKKTKTKAQTSTSSAPPITDRIAEKRYNPNLLSDLKQEKADKDFINQLESLENRENKDGLLSNSFRRRF